MNNLKVLIVLSMILFGNITPSSTWGFFAHQKINYHAVFTLPPEMVPFYKHHIEFLSAEAVTADKRRYVIKEEAARHFIDLELFGVHLDSLPHYYKDAIERFTEDSLQSYGVLPWHLLKMKHLLTDAFRTRDVDKILRYSADLGHYLADAHVPLHTTVNYDGQLTGQDGIHRFWETRLPELFYEEYDLFTGKARYIESPARTIWNIIRQSHAAKDSVLNFEKQLSEEFSDDKRYTFEDRSGRMTKEFSREYAEAYNRKLGDMVERRFRSSVYMTGCFWYTCWIDAGQPTLKDYTVEPGKSDLIEKLEPSRSHKH